MRVRYQADESIKSRDQQIAAMKKSWALFQALAGHIMLDRDVVLCRIAAHNVKVCPSCYARDQGKDAWSSRRMSF
jgi:hypothetical protein